MLGVFALAWGAAWALVNRYNYTVCVCHKILLAYIRSKSRNACNMTVAVASATVARCRRELVRQNRTCDSGLTRFDNSSSRHVDKLLSSWRRPRTTTIAYVTSLINHPAIAAFSASDSFSRFLALYKFLCVYVRMPHTSDRVTLCQPPFSLECDDTLTQGVAAKWNRIVHGLG